ncbi:tRNA glutamyl-Q(34) synthetase GluQRS [Paenibacillus hodogayensis]|uniref:tRNA glutamyl-Q(34) synthetase GluQRS n=1 Tax=Paenibacillus hodogayensis TaxID=279208 RepID=UPI0036D41901
MIRGRFAPTPSGRLHIGNARSALLAWLHIRAAEGQFILRIEDIDKSRSRAAYAEQMTNELRWLGLDWDEGPDIGGPYGPYVQSLREERFQHALETLGLNGKLYPCFCSRAELAAIASAPHGLESEGPAYPGTCRHHTEEDRASRAAAKQPSLRFAMPEREIAFDDMAMGPQRFAPGAGGDFVVKRADGVIGYQLAVVVDDAAMGVTHVVRGCDLLDSTPRQMALYESFGWPIPRFGHIPLLVGTDGRRLAKRDDAVMLGEIRAAGTKPERVVGWLAYWSGLTDRPEPLAAAELIPLFDWASVSRDTVVVTPEALRELACV